MKPIGVFLVAAVAVLSLSMTRVSAETFGSNLSVDLKVFVNEVLSSDVDEEFGSSQMLEDEAAALFLTSITHEWNRAKADINQTVPFLICKLRVPENFESGNQMLKGLLEILGPDTPVRPVLNGDKYFCILASLKVSAGEALSTETNGWIVQPFVPSQKMLPNTLNRLGELAVKSNSSTSTERPSLDLLLCPGSLLSDVSLVDKVREVLKERTASDEFALVDAISWWTATKKDQETAPVDELNETKSPRQLFWEEVFQYALETDACEDVFQNRLNATLVSSNGDASVLHLEFDNKGADSIHKLCAYAVVAALAVQPSVCTIQTRDTPTTQNYNAQWLAQSGIKNKRPWFDVGLKGKGQIVAVSDTGIDGDHCYFSDPKNEIPYDSRNDDHRKIVEYDTFVNAMDYKNGHGTHVAGSIFGQRVSVDGTDGLVDGMAPEAKGAFIDIGKQDGSLILPLSDVTLLDTGRTKSLAKAHIHSASWGSETNEYTVRSYNFDNYMYANDDFLIFVAAGNSGGDNTFSSVGSPGTAKNIMTVGASHSQGDDLANGDLGPSYIASFSSRGPTDDGRTKPEIVAPGKSILSAGANPNVIGECDTGHIPIPGTSSEGVMSMQGTSMATPIAAGHAALIRQYFEDGFYPTGKQEASNSMDPSGALVKAVLINGAQYMKGVDNGKRGGIAKVNPYDNIQNFGRISLKDSLYVVGLSNVNALVRDREEVEDGKTRSYEVTINTSNGCTNSIFSTSLTWVEAGSVPGCKTCVMNDLDLYVEKEVDGNTKRFFPNGREDKDSINNSERVQIKDVKHGETITIYVEGYNLQNNAQTFALVATGCFGGEPNTLANDQDVYKSDDSASDRKQKTIIILCSLGGALILVIGVCCFLPRKKEKKKKIMRALSRKPANESEHSSEEDVKDINDAESNKTP
eukprot:CAMPEP_0198281524 /NCGR_PEP_ID=MMETSP1449-20131203/1441_1 /TAXON_ID=420275 /ORGANISM="Attheya septentrionalis, Strain CCMP2084" /LENGTH=917 /DNA_ID=CAMNT_0043977325 /DNA_START=91 /DNA_END=2844 /DNA_ORIENTATION=+